MSTPLSSETDSFASDLAFLERHIPVLILKSEDQRAQIAVTPGYQGRVMTSTCGGLSGRSHGYLHRANIAASVRQPQITVLGGEDRFWLGPEGGPFALYFAPGKAFEYEHWQVPEPLDWGAFNVRMHSEREVHFDAAMTLTNYARTSFQLRVERAIRLLAPQEIEAALRASLGSHTQAVGYESDNQLVNAGATRWSKQSGLVSIWILGMFKPGPHTTVVIPFLDGSNARDPLVNDGYFGAIPKERLYVTDDALYFRADGLERGKLGVPQVCARDVAGSYDPDHQTLTLVQYTLPNEAADYVNSLWLPHADPYAGDVVNAYNDGPPTKGAPALGGFYELESSSPARELAPGQALRHVHRTLHLEGPENELDPIARTCLGVSLQQIVQTLDLA